MYKIILADRHTPTKELYAANIAINSRGIVKNQSHFTYEQILKITDNLTNLDNINDPKINKINKYGQVISKSSHYWGDLNRRYTLKRNYKECGCLKDDDCCCDFVDQKKMCFESQLKPNRRLLLILN